RRSGSTVSRSSAPAPESNDWFTFQESATIQPQHPAIRKRGEGEFAVRAAFADALFVRPAVMFGPDDAFLTTILNLLRQLPIYPMFGRGRIRLQPAYVEDVAEAVARVMLRAETHSKFFEFGGPLVYSYEQFLRAIAHQVGLTPLLTMQYRKRSSPRWER